MTPRPRRLIVAAAASAALAVTAACGGPADTSSDTPESSDAASATSSGSDDPSASASIADDALIIDVTIEGDEVTPNAERVEAEVGQQIVFRITSDTATEIHGHATPEFTWAVPEGTSEQTVTFDSPASVTVETHDPDRTLVQLVVR